MQNAVPMQVREGVQELKIYDRTDSGLKVDTVEYVRFVPLVKGRR